MNDQNNYQDIKELLDESYKITKDLIYEEDCGNTEICSIIHISQVMLHRLQEQINTALQLLENGSWASLEAILRVCIEYSIQAAYLFEKDTKERFGKYFFGFFSDMEKRQKQMLDAYKDEPLVQKELEQSKQFLKIRKEIIEVYCSRCGIPTLYEEKISFFQMCKDLGEEKLYRELYSKLSNVVHADADSLIDYILMYCIQHPIDKRHTAEIEVKEWIIYYFLRVLLIYVSAYSMFLECFKLDNKLKEFDDLQKDFLALYRKYTENFTILRKETLQSAQPDIRVEPGFK
jgi:predicted nucleic-acid-binding Zn-ribbon protein